MAIINYIMKQLLLLLTISFFSLIILYAQKEEADKTPPDEKSETVVETNADSDKAGLSATNEDGLSEDEEEIVIKEVIKEDLNISSDITPSTSITIGTETNVIKGDIVISDSTDEDEYEVSLFRRAEIIAIISAPFTVIYTRLLSGMVDRGELFGASIPILNNSSGRDRIQRAFFIVTSIAWSFAILRDDIAKVYKRRVRARKSAVEREEAMVKFSPDVSFTWDDDEGESDLALRLGFFCKY